MIITADAMAGECMVHNYKFELNVYLIKTNSHQEIKIQVYCPSFLSEKSCSYCIMLVQNNNCSQ